MGNFTVKNHLPILSSIINELNVKSVFEFGIGIHSTGLFLENCDLVYSIEMNEHTINQVPWFDYVNQMYSSYEKDWVRKKIIGKFEAIDFFKKLNLNFDLVFVDGHGDSRAAQANMVFGKSKVIVIHDAQHQKTQKEILQNERYCKFYFEDFGKNYIRKNGDSGPVPGIMVFVRNDLDSNFLHEISETEASFEKFSNNNNY